MFTVTQILLITLLYTYNQVSTSLFNILYNGRTVLLGAVTGLIMGDLPSGLFIGGTYELMSVGLNPLGGSSVPNYNLGAVVGVAFAAVTSVEVGVAAGLVVSTLATSLDVVGKTVGSFFVAKANTEIKRHNFKKAFRWIHIGFWPRILLIATIPTFLILVAGSSVVSTLNDMIPAWLLSGFENAGKMLPALGFAILLRSLKVKGNIQYVMIGYVLFAYVGLDALGTAIIGAALAMMAYYQETRYQGLAESSNGGDDDE